MIGNKKTTTQISSICNSNRSKRKDKLTETWWWSYRKYSIPKINSNLLEKYI